jgi:hypothetical protein
MRLAPPLRFSTSLIALAALGSCVGPPVQEAPRPVPVPAPTPAPRPRPTAAPQPLPPAQADWRDWPATPGNWSYRRDERGSIALFGRPGSDAELTLRCDRARSQIFLSRRGDPGSTAPLPTTIRTSSTLRALSAQPTGGGEGYFAVPLGVNDPLLDAMGYSRGRFVIEGGGLPPLVIPAWAEILRVVEDCR